MAIERLSGEQSVDELNCKVVEFGVIGDSDLAEARINGRYPKEGFAFNEYSDMMIRVISGAGAVAMRSTSHELATGDVVRIEKQTPYYYEGDELQILMISSPAWSSDQYKVVD